MTAAEKDLRQAQSMVETIRQRLEGLRAKEAAGLITGTEVKRVQLLLDSAQAERTWPSRRSTS